jgi:hypothetical protein
MNSRKVWNLIAVVALLVAMLSVPGASQPAAAQATDLSRVEGLVLTQLAESGQTDFFVWLTEQADLSPAKALPTAATCPAATATTARLSSASSGTWLPGT